MTTPSIFADRRALILIATFCCLLWGSAVPIVKLGYGIIGIAPGDTPSLLLFAGLRFCLAGLLLLAYGLATGRAIFPKGRQWAEVTLLGLVQTALQYACYYVGLAHTTAVKTSILSTLLVFFSVILAHFLYANDKLTARRALGCLIGFTGVVTVNFAAGVFDFHVSGLGEGLLVISNLAGSIAAIYGRRISQGMDAAVMTGWQLLLGGIVLTSVGTATGGHFANLGIAGFGLIAYLAAVSALAFGLWSLLLKHNPVSSVAIFNFELPIFGTLLSALVLGESVLEWKNLVALVLVSIGIYLVTIRGRIAAVVTGP